MAVSYTVAEQNSSDPVGLASMGNTRVRFVTLSAVAAGTYTTGGDTVLATALQGNKVLGGVAAVSTTADAAEVAILIPQADGSMKVKLNDSAGAENGNGAVMTGLVLHCMIFVK